MKPVFTYADILFLNCCDVYLAQQKVCFKLANDYLDSVAAAMRETGIINREPNKTDLQRSDLRVSRQVAINSIFEPNPEHDSQIYRPPHPDVKHDWMGPSLRETVSQSEDSARHNRRLELDMQRAEQLRNGDNRGTRITDMFRTIREGKAAHAPQEIPTRALAGGTCSSVAMELHTGGAFAA